VNSNDMFGNGSKGMVSNTTRPTGPSKEALEAAKRYEDKQLALEKEEKERRAENFRRGGKYGESIFRHRKAMFIRFRSCDFESAKHETV